MPAQSPYYTFQNSIILEDTQQNFAFINYSNLFYDDDKHSWLSEFEQINQLTEENLFYYEEKHSWLPEFQQINELTEEIKLAYQDSQMIIEIDSRINRVQIYQDFSLNDSPPSNYQNQEPNSLQNNSRSHGSVQSNQSSNSMKRRMGSTQLPNVLKIHKKITGSHICKNIPEQIFRKIKKHLKKIKKSDLLDQQKKRYNMNELIEFILKSKLEVQDWESVFDLDDIYETIDRSKKLGTAKNHKKKDEKVKSFLVEMNKKTQKILFRSIKRIIMDIFNGEIDSFDSYIDDQAHQQLHDLQSFYLEQNSREYKSLICQLKQA